MISNHAPLQGSGYKYTSGGDHCLALSSCSFKKTFSLSCATEKVLTQTVLYYKFKDSKNPMCCHMSLICSAMVFAIKMYRFDN